MQRSLKSIGAILVSILVLAILALMYLMGTRQAGVTARLALESTEAVTVTSEDWHVFEPTDTTPTTGLIIYPGSFVDVRAYAPAGQVIAESGYLVVLVPMPLNLAALAPERANEVIASFPDIANWVVGGHGQGGSVSARFAAQNADSVEGLLLWASTPRGDDLSDSSVIVMSIYGTEDGHISPEQIESFKSLLPFLTEYIAITGGNHTQFGDYGLDVQSGDNPATISIEAQMKVVGDLSVEFLERVTLSAGGR